MTERSPVDELAAIPQPWERIPEESARAYAAFCRYRDMTGEARSIARAAEEAHGASRAKRRGAVDSVVTQFERWSSEHFWVARAQQYDDLLAREQHLAFLDERRTMGVEHARAADALLKAGVDALEGVKPEEMSVADIARYIEIGIKLGRLVRGADEAADDEVPVVEPQDQVLHLLAEDAQLTRAAAAFGAQILRAEREADEEREAS